MAATIRVEVAYALPERQEIVQLEVPEGSTALEAAVCSGLDERFPGLVIDEHSKLGIFGAVVPSTRVLRDGERVEIYRPLIADPKDARRARAERARASQ